MQITIERAAPADAEILVRVQIAAFHDDARLYPGEEESGPPGYDSVENMLQKIDENETYKIVVDGQIVGGIVVFAQGHDHYHIDVLFVEPGYHSLGIGTATMQFIDQTYPAVKWTLHTPMYAIRNQHFYEKFGFKRVGEDVEPGGIRLIAYEKEVST